MRTRAIPVSGQELPSIGMGTWRTFDTEQRDSVRGVMRAVFDAGGSVIGEPFEVYLRRMGAGPR